MRKNIFVTSLKTALLALPLLAACKSPGTTLMFPTTGLTFPDCAPGQLISVGADKVLGCTQTLTTNLSPPSCPAKYALNAVDGNLLCMPVGTGSTNSDLQAAITNVITKTTSLQNQINNFGGGGGAAKYCGQTTGTTPGRITNNGAVGVAAASQLCNAVAACGAGAHMCTVYELYESASAGVITQAQTISKSWAFMAAWNNGPGSTEPTAGMSDNCASFTYGTGDQAWRGTAFKWDPRNNGEKVLKFFTGPTGTGNTEGAGCAEVLPIACCK
jgi:hypothetical protein